MTVRRPLLFALAVLLVAGAAKGDWLVLRDGSRIETRGAWTAKERTVVFTSTAGTLSSLRLDEVDLEASAAATTAAQQEAAAPAAPVKKAPVLVLTDKDVSHVTDEGEEVAADVAAAAGAAAAAAAKADPVTVTRWERVENAEFVGTILVGGVKNSGESVASDLQVTAELYGVDEKLLATADASLSARALQPGQTAAFRVELAGVPVYSSVRFKVSYRPLAPGRTAPPEPPPAPGNGVGRR
jgi:hypothetical protein